MRKYLTFLCIVIGVSAYGQTNTFPTSGNVGIGTNSPSLPLDVRGAAVFSSEIVAPGGFRVGSWLGDNVNGVPWYGLGGSNLVLPGAPAGTGSVQLAGYWGLNLQTALGQMVMTNPGNVGIGTTTPDQKLVVAGNLKLVLDLTVFPAKNVSSIVALGHSGITGAQNWAIRGAYQYPTGVGGNADGGDLDIVKSLDGNTILGTKTDGTPLGNVGIGTTNPQGYKLAVNGTIRAQEIKVESSNWPDYVFTPEHKLPSLETLATQIKEQGHLPSFPSAEEVSRNGIALGEMNKKLLEKIEELTLYAIKQNEESRQQKELIKELKVQSEEMRQLKELLFEQSEQLKMQQQEIKALKNRVK